MADFSYGAYKNHRLFLQPSEGNVDYEFDPENTYLDIGLKGTKADGLVQKRMSAIKDQMNSSLKDLMKDGVKPGSGKKSGLSEDLKNML